MATNQDKIKFTSKQRQAIEILANPEFDGTITDLCEEINVARSTYYKWLDKPEFLVALDNEISKHTDSALGKVWGSLLRECYTGNSQAIKLFFELKNKYKSNVDVNISSTSGILSSILNQLGDDA